MRSSTCAVMFRCHFRSPEIDRAIDRFKNTGSANFVILKDQTSNRDKFEDPCIYFDAHSVEKLGLSTFGSNQWAWCMGDYALYAAMDNMPDCDHFLMVDYDVYVNFNIQNLVNECLSGNFDYVAGYAGFKNDSWMWSKYSRRWFSDSRGSFFPIVFASRRLLENCLQFRRLVSRKYFEDCANGLQSADTFNYMLNCEAVLPSIAVETHSTICDLQKVIPGFSYEYFRDVDFLPLEYFPFEDYKASHPALPIDVLFQKLQHAISSGLPHGDLMAERFFALVRSGILPVADHKIENVMKFLSSIPRIWQKLA